MARLEDGVDYDAFVSYAHGSGHVATALQAGLQRFAKAWWRRRALRVFLDSTALSANPNLWSSIADAIDTSDWFLLVASPGAADSPWVNREVQHWLNRHGTERLLIAVADGEWIWERGTTGSGLSGNAVPNALVTAFGEEPRHIDFRWANGDTDLSLGNPRFRDQLAELAAPIHHVSKDALEGADFREYRRFRRIAVATGVVLSLLTVASIIATIAAVSFANRASARTADADFARLVAQSRNLSASDPSLAILLAVEATRLRSNAQSNGAILATLSGDPRFVANVLPRQSDAGVASVCVPGKLPLAVIGGTGGTITGVSLTSRVHVTWTVRFRPRESGPVSVSCSHNSASAIAYDNGYWRQLVPQTGQETGPLHRDLGLYRAAVSPSGTEVALADTNGPAGSGRLTLVPLGGDEPSRSVVLSHLIIENGVGLAFSPDGNAIATVNASKVCVWSASDLSLLFSRSGGPKVAAISATPRTPLLQETNDAGDAAFSPDGRLLVTSEGSNIQLIDVGTQSLLWSDPTGWYAGSQVGFTDDGRLLVNGSAGSIEQLNVINGSPMGEAITPHIGVAINLAFDGARLVAGSNSSSTVAIYDLDFNGPITRALPLPPSTGLLEYDPVGASLLLELNAASDPVVVSTRSVNDKTGMLGPMLPPMVFPRFIEPHVVGGLLTSSLKIGEIDSNTARLAIPAYSVPFTHASNAQFNPHSHLVALANIGGQIYLYDEHGIGVAAPWIKLGSYPVLSSSGFANNGSIAVFDIGDQRVWVLNRKGRVVLQKSADVTMAALSPDANRLAILHDVHIDLFDAHSGAQIGGSIGVPPGSTDIEWSADGSRLLAFGQQEGQLIDALDGQPLGDPLPSDGYLALRPDGNEVASIINGKLVLWDVDLAQLTSAACQAAGRNLTPAEWTQYLPNEGSYQRVCPQWP